MGSLVGIIGELMSPWPAFIFDTAREMYNDPFVAVDPVLPTLITISAPVVAYVLFPVFGFGLGYFSGWVLERRMQ